MDDEARELQAWQVAEIMQGLVEAERGEFATDEELEELLKKWASRSR